MADLGKRDRKTGRSGSDLRLGGDPAGHRQAGKQHLVLQHIGLVLVEAAFQHVNLAVMAADLLLDTEPASQRADWLLVDGVVAHQPLAQDGLGCLDQQQADQVQHAGAPSAQVAVPFDALEGLQAAGLVDHLQDSEVAARQLGDHMQLRPLKPDHADPGSRADAQSPVMQPVQIQPVVTVAAGEAGDPAVELDEEAVQRHRKGTAISSWHVDP